jgi:hypothetical protein
MGVPPAELERLLAATEGKAPTGTVSLRDFDQGVVETMGAVPQKTANGEYYFLTVPGISPAPGWPGVPVAFSYGEDVFSQFRQPMLMVRRDDISPAMQRWHPGSLQYRAPATGARPVEVHRGTKVMRGYDRYAELQQAVPFDLMYTIQIETRYRGAKGSRNETNTLLDYVLRVYPPYCRVVVKDSLGDVRSYEAFMEGTAPLDEVADVADRMMGMALTLRIEAELDLHDPEVRRAATGVQVRTSLRR